VSTWSQERINLMKTMMEAAPARMLNGAAVQVASMAESASEVEPPAPPRTRHTQSAEQATTAAAVGEMLAGLQAAGEPLRALLEHDGITAACIADCTAQHVAALAARDARQQAMAAQRQAVAALNAAFDHAHWGIMALRQVARTVFSDAAAHTALGLNEEFPQSPTLFVNEARRVLAVAQQAPYAAALAAVAYSTPRLQEMQDEIDAVEAAYVARLVAEGQALQATGVRNAEFAKMNRLARRVRVQVNALLRRHPEVARPAGFD